MLRNKYVIAAVIMLLVLVIGFNIRFFSARKIIPAGKTSGRQMKSTQTVQRQSMAPVSFPEDIKRAFEVPDKVAWKSDPFRLQQITEKTSVSTPLLLTGIIKRDGMGHALINGKVYRVNDMIDNYKIKEIRQHSVILSDGKKQREISFEDYKVLKEKKK